MRRVVAGLFVLVAGCGPGDDAVRAEFLRAHPGAEVLSLGVGEGDDDHAYYGIRYRLPNDSTVHEACWLYSDAQGGDWRLVNRTEGQRC